MTCPNANVACLCPSLVHPLTTPSVVLGAERGTGGTMLRSLLPTSCNSFLCPDVCAGQHHLHSHHDLELTEYLFHLRQQWSEGYRTIKCPRGRFAAHNFHINSHGCTSQSKYFTV